MSSTAVGDLVVLVLVSAAAFSTGWVLRDAQARGLPRRKALTWAALQWIAAGFAVSVDVLLTEQERCATRQPIFCASSTMIPAGPRT